MAYNTHGSWPSSVENAVAPPLITEEFLPSLTVNSELDTHQITGGSILAPGTIFDSNGRTYQGYREGKYFLPNDAAEQDRLDFQSAGTRVLLDGQLALAPIRSPRRVLDVATGTGIWAVEFAQLHPESEVVGSDLTQIQPTSGLPNLSFVQEDSEEHPWVHDRPFDYIHLRYVYTCFDSPQSVIRSVFENLNPGGWIEFQDATMELHSNKGPAHIENNPLKRLFDLAIQGAAAQGRNIVVSRFYKQWLLEAGFVDVAEIKLAIPINEWHTSLKLKRVGQYTSRMLMDSLGGVAWKMLRAKGFSDEEINETIVQTKPEIRNLDLEAFFPFWVVYGRKPE
ncbi:hypothetical protein G7054_g4911 [Neopestalotiopsis clavispora]|nr:hypothetical protein G7054_g4911 [Neopestalotiopsis clavispora]